MRWKPVVGALAVGAPLVLMVVCALLGPLLLPGWQAGAPGTPNLPQLVARLRHHDASVRRSAVASLGGITGGEARDAFEALLDALPDRHPEVREAVVESLVRLARPLGKDASDSLRRILREGAPAARPLAAIVLGRLGPAADEAVPDLVRALDDPDASLRRAAGLALFQIAPPREVARSAGVELSGSSAASSWARIACAGVVHPDDAVVVADLADALTDDNLAVRRWSAEMLGLLATALPEVRKARPLLESRFGSPPEAAAAGTALARLAPEEPDVVAFLVKAVFDGGHSQQQAYLALAEVSADPRGVALLRYRGAVDALTTALDSGEPGTLERAAQALQRIGPGWADPALPSLERALDNGSPAVARALARLDRRPRPPVDILMVRAAAMHYGLDAREDLAEVVGQIGPRALPLIRPYLTNPTPGYPAAGASALGAMGPAARAALPDLQKLLRSPDPLARLAAARAMWRIDPGSWESVLPVLADGLPSGAGPAAPHATLLATRSLTEMGPLALSALPRLRRALAQPPDPQGDPVSSVVEALGPLASAAVPDMVAPTGLERTHTLAGIRAMKAIGPEASPAVGSLLSSLAGPDRDRGFEAACALAAIDPARTEGLPVLLEALRWRGPARDLEPVGAGTARTWVLRREVPRRDEVVLALARLGPRADKAVPLLVELLGQGKPAPWQVRLALAEIGPASVPALIDALKDPFARRGAAQCLGDLGPAAKEAVEPLKNLARSRGVGPGEEWFAGKWPNQSALAHQAVFEALERVGGPEAVKGIEAPERRDMGEEPAGAEALMRLAEVVAVWRTHRQARAVLPDLVALLREEGPASAELLALEVLAQMGPEGAPAVGAVCQKLFSVRPAVRQRAAEVLGLLGDKAKVALPHLEHARKDRHAGVRKAVEEAIAKVRK